MSLHALATDMASRGRGPDSMLVHMAPQEVAGLQALAMKHGGSLTINPDTGLPEAGFLSKLLPMLAGAALNYFAPGFGTAISGALGLGEVAGAAAIGTGIGVGGATALATGSLSRGLMAGLGAYGGAGLTEGLMSAGSSESMLSSGALNKELAQGAQAGLTEGEAFNKFLTSDANPAVNETLKNATSLEKLTAGTQTAMANPMQFAKDNWKYLAGAAAPIAADLMVPTTTKVPELKNNASIAQSIYDPYSGTMRRLNPVPAAGYGTPSWKPFAAGGIVALAAGGMPHYDGSAGSVVGGGGLENIYANLGGKQVYDKIASDYMKAGGDEAGLASIMSKYSTPVAAPAAAAAPAGLTAQQQQAMNLMLQSSTGGVDTSAMDALGGSAAVRKLAESAGYTGTPTQLYDYAAAHPGSIDWTSDAGRQLAMNNYTAGYSNTLASKFKTPQEQALELMYRSTTQGVPTAALDALGGSAAVRKLAEAAGFDATPEWQAEYERKMGYPVVSRMSTAESIAADKAANTGLASLNRVDAGADTRLDYTGDGTSTVKPVAINTAGTYTGTSTTAPAIGTTIGQGTYVGQGSDSTTGTTGGIMDFGGKSAFGATSPLALAKQQIADQSAAKTAADKAKMDMYRQWVAQNPTAVDLDHANFLDKIGLDAATAAQATPLSADQMQSRYYDAKFNKQTGDSMAAYNYLMGKGAYPTKSGVGEIMRPYSEATLGMPANPNRKYIFDQATGKYKLNPDFAQQYNDPSGGVNYLLSPNEIFQYFKANQGQDDATTYAWAVENNLTPQDIAAATGVPLSQVAAKWRAAKAKQATAAADKKAADEKAAAANTKQDDSSTGGLATGGMAYAVGGLGSLGGYSDGGRLLKGPGDGVSDSIPATIGRNQQPARLADGEFVVPARIVSELGNGSTDAGAKKLYAMMDRVQRARSKTTGKNKVAANSRADKYLPA